MPPSDLIEWMEEYNKPGFVWFAKRLAANDTLASGSHQSGPYIPKDLMFRLFPELGRVDVKNPDVSVTAYISSEQGSRPIRAVWYNGKFHDGTRDETRFTQFGGRSSPLLDPENTGALTLFVFQLDSENVVRAVFIWVCGNDGAEADIIEEILGPVEPKASITWTPGTVPVVTELDNPDTKSTCWISQSELPTRWLSKLPSGRDIIEMTLLKRPRTGRSVDALLLNRRDCEFEIFKSVQEAYWFTRINRVYDSTEHFVEIANSVIQSRKSRSGKSLEYHASAIFREEGLRSGIDFVQNPKLKMGGRPDFIFPNTALYDNVDVPEEFLTFLAAKTTCKDRWRQILVEDKRKSTKHLLTLQRGVSESQFAEMSDHNVKLVVPASYHRNYPKSVRPNLMTLTKFIREVRSKRDLMNSEGRWR